VELKQLEAFVNVYELQSFSKAAQRMYISQPSISAYIAALEKQLGSQLIHRAGKEFLPTQAGHVLYEHAKEMLSLREKVSLSLKNISAGSAGCVNILASSVPAQYILPRLLSKFHKNYPEITFSVNQTGTAKAIDGLAKHKGEIAFVGAIIEDEKLEYEHLITEKLVLIAPHQSSFLNLKQVDVAQILRQEYFVTRCAGSGTRLIYEDFLGKIGLKSSELKISASMDDAFSILQAVASGLGLSLVSELAARPFIEQKLVTTIDLCDVPKRDFYIVKKKGYPITPATQVFLDFIQANKHCLEFAQEQGL